ncbi:WXG100 family type VII secretion target [Nocardia sp. NPDC049707]|uniref:WXG100 family type VII secretion target n=1 Tax=Nocardia sp. NPDC049707 TaxID=3154735 RepID=UPI00341808BF
MTGNEPKQIPGNGENTKAWSHGDIKDAFETLNAGNAYQAAVQYSNAATYWDQGVETFARSVLNSIAQAWEGAAAESAKDAIKRYTDDARKLEPALTQLSQQIEYSANSIADTRKAIPGYADHSWTANIWPPRKHEEERSRNDAEEAARTAMNTNYVNRYAEYDTQIPVLPTGLNPTQPLDIPAPRPGEGPGNGGGNNNGGGSGPTGDGNPGGTDGEGKDGQGKDGTTETGETTGDQTTPESSTTSPNTTSTTPTGYSPTTTDPSTLESTKTTPSGVGTPSTTGTPGIPGGTGNTTGSPGRSIPGMPATTGTSGTSPTTTAAAAARGMNGMPGMMGGAGRGGKSEDESTHQTPDYLINQANTDELIGDIPKTVSGGVIGGDPST